MGHIHPPNQGVGPCRLVACAARQGYGWAFFGVLALTISRPIVLVLLCLLACSAACSPASEEGGGGFGGGGFGGSGGSGGVAISARLVVESATSVTLIPSDEVTIVVRYLDDSQAPIANAPISFTLVGRAQDSGLSQLTSTTDNQGRATTHLIAGAQNASFQVRVSAADALPVVIDAAVSDRGFGNLRAFAPYAGRRGVTQRRVALFAGRTCAEIESGAAPDRQSNLTSLSDDARFIGLPAATRYAVLAVGFGAPAVALAQGCEDEVEVKADQEVAVDVTMADLDLVPWGDYTVEVSVATGNFAMSVSDQVRTHAMADPPGVTTSPAQRLLTALDEALRADPTAVAQLAAADLLQQLRDPGGADTDLQAALDAAAVGPSRTLAWISDRMGGELQTINFVFDVQLALENEAQTASWTLRRATAMSNVVDSGAIEHVIAEPTASIVEPTFDWPQDRMETGVGAPAVFGALSVELIDAVMDDADGAGWSEARQWLGCSVLETWVQEHSAIADACDTACVSSACDRLLSTLVSSLQSSLVAMDTLRPVTTLDGIFNLVDENADGVVDVLDAPESVVSWPPDPADTASMGDSFHGTARGEVVVVTGAP